MASNRQNRRVTGLNFRLAWRNIWRQKRRTWLTALAMVFSNILMVFMISLQFGSYEMMINNTLRMFSGQLQVQHEGYLDNPATAEIVIGSVMARNLKVGVGDELTFLGSGMDGSFAAGVRHGQ